MTDRSVHRYGDHPAQVAELFRPTAEPCGIAVVLHGGFWRAAYDRHLTDDLCESLAAGGWAAWNLEYRRIAGGGGGWPNTFLDVAAGIDHLARLDTFEGQALGGAPESLDAGDAAGTLARGEAGNMSDRDTAEGLAPRPVPKAVGVRPSDPPAGGQPRLAPVKADAAAVRAQSPRRTWVVTIGHSAGGHLALWAAARHLLPAGAPGADPGVRVTHAISQAGVVDLAEAARLRLSHDAAAELVGASRDAEPERWRLASPAALLPLGVPQLLVHGARDDIVPAAMSEDYAWRARELGDAAAAVVLPGVGHFEHLDHRAAAWLVVRDWLDGLA